MGWAARGARWARVGLFSTAFEALFANASETLRTPGTKGELVRYITRWRAAAKDRRRRVPDHIPRTDLFVLRGPRVPGLVKT